MCSYRELHEMWDFIWNTFLATFYTISYTNTTWNLSMEQRLIRMLHINRVQEPHVNLDSFTFQPVSQRKWSKFHLKIPTRESQHILQSNLSQIHSYDGVKRPNKQRNSNPSKLCFSQQLLWASCCWDAQGISCSFCAIAIQLYTV